MTRSDDLRERLVLLTRHLGFVGRSHFTRFFKRVTGETPSGFAAGFAPDP